jgi:hypothetical protein
MNRIHRTLAVLLACLPLLAACGRQPDPPASTGPGAQPTSALGNVVKKATDKAREEMATGNISIDGDMHIKVNGREFGRDGSRTRAEITPQGDLLIEGKPVAVDPRQRELLLQYRRQIIDIAGAGMDIGVQGADLGMKAAREAIASIFSGNPDQVEKRVEAEAAGIEAAAMRLCDQLPAMLATQRQLAASLPAFAPYATMKQEDIDDCYSKDDAHDARARTQVQRQTREEIRSGIRRTVQAAVRGSGGAQGDPGMDAAAEAEAAPAEDASGK